MEEYLLLDYDIDLFFEVSALQILGNNNNIMLFFYQEEIALTPCLAGLRKQRKVRKWRN